MRQVTILSVLALLLILAVGVTFAREGELAGGPVDSADPLETTAERTDLEGNLPDTTTPTETPPVDEGRSEKTVDDRDPREENKEKRERGTENAARAEGDRREVPTDGRGRTGGTGEGREKVTVCHKGKKTLIVGAPAKEAHLRHGDTLGGCRGGP